MAAITRAQANRWIVAGLAAASLTGGASIAIFDSQQNPWCGSLIRLGVLLIAFWIAMPTKGRAAAWADVSPYWVIGIAVALLFVLRRPMVLIPLLLAVFVLGVAAPRLFKRQR